MHGRFLFEACVGGLLVPAEVHHLAVAGFGPLLGAFVAHGADGFVELLQYWNESDKQEDCPAIEPCPAAVVDGAVEETVKRPATERGHGHGESVVYPSVVELVVVAQQASDQDDRGDRAGKDQHDGGRRCLPPDEVEVIAQHHGQAGDDEGDDGEEQFVTHFGILS